MRKLNYFAFLFILSILQFLDADTTTIVLQNGLAGYNGCEDSYNFTETLDSNYSTLNKFHIWNCVA